MSIFFEDTKVCKECGEEKPLSEFYKHGKYYRGKCKECLKKYWKLPENRERHRINERNRCHRNGIYSPMDKNKECTAYLGIVVAERVLEKVFKNVKRMPNNNPGFDFICNKGYKIDIKSACLHFPKNRKNPYWHFNIEKNHIAHYFLCIAFDNRKDLNPKHIWLIPNKILRDKNTFAIVNTEKILSKWEQYELNEKLEQVITCCDTLKGEA